MPPRGKLSVNGTLEVRVVTLDMARNNRWLSALPAQALARWLPRLEELPLPLSLVLRESGQQTTHAVFPTTAIVCLVLQLEDGRATETAVVGREGLVGMPLIMGGETTLSRAEVKSAGRGLRLPAEFLMAEFQHHPEVRRLLLRHTQALMTQTAQTAVCNRHHALDQQLCRWLLLWHDRSASDEFAVTQELVANMLGVRREGVTEALGKLNRAGVLRCRRSFITVLKRSRLEQRACECYAVVRREYERLLAPVEPEMP